MTAKLTALRNAFANTLNRLHNFFGRYPAATWLVAGMAAVISANDVLGLVDTGVLAGYLRVIAFALALVCPSIAPNGVNLLSWAAELVDRAKQDAAAEAARRGSENSRPVYDSLLGREPPEHGLGTPWCVKPPAVDPGEPPC